MSTDTSYDKIKHLVENEDDIFAVFTINSTGEVYNLTVAKNIDFENSLVENIYTNFNMILNQDDKITDILEYSYRIPSNKREIEMKKNSSLLVLGIVSISLLLILSAIQSSTAQRDDDDDHDKDKWKWNRHDDDDDKDHDKDKWNRHDDDDHDRDDFKLTVRLTSDGERHIPDYKVKVSGETKSIDGKEFEDDSKANVKFYLNDVDNKEKVCITNERNR